ncbi:MAG: pyruvate kinase, partial [Pseudomonadota bacterium]
PTRAEATDVANAVLDGTDAVMLSEETASGSYPVAAVRYMSRLAHHAEDEASMGRFLESVMPEKDVSESVAHASCVLARHLGASAIVASTVSGQTARHISRFRPHTPILALSPSLRTIRQLTLYWGCVPIMVPPPEDADDLIETSAQMALASGIVSRGDLIIITAGHPVGGAGTTNMLRVKTLE